MPANHEKNPKAALKITGIQTLKMFIYALSKMNSKTRQIICQHLKNNNYLKGPQLISLNGGLT